MKTVSLELAKQLKEADFFPRSGFDGEMVWIETYPWGLLKKSVWKLKHKSKFDFKKGGSWEYSPTADEILEKLPDYILKSENRTYYIQINKKPYGEYEILYRLPDSEILGGDPADGRNENASHALDKSLADAAAKMWLYLKENDLLGVK